MYVFCLDCWGQRIKVKIAHARHTIDHRSFSSSSKNAQCGQVLGDRDADKVNSAMAEFLERK
jgi:hypothetical protein